MTKEEALSLEKILTKIDRADEMKHRRAAKESRSCGTWQATQRKH